MLERILANLHSKCGLVDNRPILVAVSGGPDSLCLLDCLHRLDYPLIVAHFNHRLRIESASDAEAVRQISIDMKLPCVIGQVEEGNLAEAKGFSLEEAARNVRYGFLFKQAESHHAQAIAVGHSADDQVETVLMHLLRGTGLSGLKGMVYRSLPNAWSQSIPLVRPLLDTWREEIMAYLSERNLHPCLDESNLDVRFYRNRLRNEVIPYLEKVHPHIRQNLWRTAEILGQDLRVIESILDESWYQCVVEKGSSYLAFSTADLRKQPLGLQRHLIRKGIEHLRPGLRNVDFDAIERALQFLHEPSASGIVDLLAGLYLSYENLGAFGEMRGKNERDKQNLQYESSNYKELMWLATWEADLPNMNWPQMAPYSQIKLDIPGEMMVGSGWWVIAEPVSDIEAGRAQACSNTDPYQAWFDLDSLTSPLSIRTRRSGDRFRPLGMAGRSMKVADLMVNGKLPRRARDRWPLVTSGEEIIWVPGIRIGQDLRVKEATDRILRLQLTRTV